MVAEDPPEVVLDEVAAAPAVADPSKLGRRRKLLAIVGVAVALTAGAVLVAANLWAGDEVVPEAGTPVGEPGSGADGTMPAEGLTLGSVVEAVDRALPPGVQVGPITATVTWVQRPRGGGVEVTLPLSTGEQVDVVLVAAGAGGTELLVCTMQVPNGCGQAAAGGHQVTVSGVPGATMSDAALHAAADDVLGLWAAVDFAPIEAAAVPGVERPDLAAR